MVRCYLSRLMGERRVRIAEVSRATGISRNQLGRLYYDQAKRVELADLEALCRYFNCGLSDLLEIVPEPTAERTTPQHGRLPSGATELKRRPHAKSSGRVPHA